MCSSHSCVCYRVLWRFLWCVLVVRCCRYVLVIVVVCFRWCVVVIVVVCCKVCFRRCVMVILAVCCQVCGCKCVVIPAVCCQVCFHMCVVVTPAMCCQVCCHRCVVIPVVCWIVPFVLKTWGRQTRNIEYYSHQVDDTIPTIDLGIPNTEGGEWHTAYLLILPYLTLWHPTLSPITIPSLPWYYMSHQLAFLLYAISSPHLSLPIPVLSCHTLPFLNS